jgi:hypothetical protein
VPHELGEQITRAPGLRKVIRQVRIQEFAGIRACHRLRGDQQVMRAALEIRKYRITRTIGFPIGEVHAFAGRGVMVSRPVDDTLVLHDLPERISAHVRRYIRRFVAEQIDALAQRGVGNRRRRDQRAQQFERS